MGFQEIVIKKRAEGGAVSTAKIPHVVMTDGKKFVFNLAAANQVGNVEGLNAAVLYDAESGSVGFRFNKSSTCPVTVGVKTLTIKANIADVLPDVMRRGKWQANIAWNKEAQVFEAWFGLATEAAKRGEKEAAKLASMSEEKRAEYLGKKAERQAAEKAKRAAEKAVA